MAKMGVLMREQSKARPHLSVLALMSFIGSFVVARAFTTVHPDIWLIRGGFHIHHFWYGLFMLGIGGWLGISYDYERVSRVAAIIFGAGGGLVGDEIGLLLTLNDYWTGLTYMIVMIFLAVSSLLVLVAKYSRIIRLEFTEFLSDHVGLYAGVFLVLASVAFIFETDIPEIRTYSGLTTLAGCVLIAVYLINRMKLNTSKAGA
jgi:hypothetical protein